MKYKRQAKIIHDAAQQINAARPVGEPSLCCLGLGFLGFRRKGFRIWALGWVFTVSRVDDLGVLGWGFGLKIKGLRCGHGLGLGIVLKEESPCG